jgi:dolichol-phosphate mannosyltransferase
MIEIDEFTGRVAVIIPTYNERDNIGPITTRVRSALPAADLLIVDDNSPDGTGRLADELAAADEQGYDTIVEMDADGSHQPEELPKLLAALAGADIAFGSRWVSGGETLNWPKSRAALSRAGNAYARIMLGIPLHDMTGGYRVYRASALQKIGLHNVESVGYCFQVDLARRAVQAGLTVAEVPITFVERTHGTSKMSKAIVCEALWQVTRWGITSRLHGHRAALAVPIAAR